MRLRVQLISKIDPAVLPTSHAKIETSFQLFDEYADPAPLMAGFGELDSKLTPSKFLHWMRQAARANKQRIVLPEAMDHRILMAAAQAQSKGLAQIVLLGAEDDVRQVRRPAPRVSGRDTAPRNSVVLWHAGLYAAHAYSFGAAAQRAHDPRYNRVYNCVDQQMRASYL